MPVEVYDDLEWEISELPCGSSTPDELFELSYNATTVCPDCEGVIEGTANYWSHDDYGGGWLNSVDYEPCECHEEEEDDDDEDIL